MPPAPVDPDRHRSLAAALGALGECAGGGAQEVLSQFPELGDRQAQGVLDAWVDQLADLLRAVEETAGELAGRVSSAAASPVLDRSRR
jgi:hypothetical protein